jgi:uncharacterized membrane protein YozB (DUF420 family)
MTVQDLPALNASLNGLCTFWLVAGYICIKTGRKKGHAVLMILALVTSAAFLVGYISYHAGRGGEVTLFPRDHPLARWIYLCILIPHSILAAVNVPLVVLTVVAAARQRFERHRKLARWTFPIWLYVSVTGVLVYMMLYQWFPGEERTPGAETVESEMVEPGAGEGQGAVSFDQTVFEYHAKPEEEVLQVSFVMGNRGKRPIKITGLDTSCTCLGVGADKKEVAPGEKTRIEAEFSLATLAGDAEKFIYVRTDSPDLPEVRLTVRVRVDPLFRIEPKMLDWKVGEEPGEKRIRFQVLRERPINIVSATSSKDSVAVRVEEIEQGKVYDLVLQPGSTAQSTLGMVRIVTDCEIEKHRTQLAYFSVKQSGQDE